MRSDSHPRKLILAGEARGCGPNDRREGEKRKGVLWVDQPGWWEGA